MRGRTSVCGQCMDLDDDEKQPPLEQEAAEDEGTVCCELGQRFHTVSDTLKALGRAEETPHLFCGKGGV